MTATPKSVKATQYYNYSATQKANAEFLYRYFSARGWTRSAIAGMLGNMTVESYLLPDITEIGGGGGYGLVQWTPASKLINWTRANGLDYRTLTGQAARIQYEMTHGIQFYPSYTSSMTAAQYMKSNASAYTLAIVFLANYERPYDSNQPERGNIAMYWYNYLGTINLSDNTNNLHQNQHRIQRQNHKLRMAMCGKDQTFITITTEIKLVACGRMVKMV
ncbi:Uncharacterised protein [Weissella viridescens]|uniref:Phage tail lysozyme domain-containing protein n=1 Tax=Weissella viridescens TaxID=1629 RepID=A0A380NY98_WEIVI|nr:Uncharacterised protein [Weissella viridescens]